MLTQEQNEKLTQVGPGTPMGELMRRYWHPLTGSSVLNEENPTKEVRLLGEDLVLFRSTSGELGLIEPSCPHRKANLSYGVPEPEGIRCAYHGWLFDVQGNCVDQPSEPAGSRFKEKVKIKAYPVQELGGFIFAYLGPQPAPLLPRYDVLAWEGYKDGWSVELPCNWLQCQENSLDPLHFQWLHRYWGGWEMNRMKTGAERDAWNSAVGARGAEHRKIGFEVTDYGVIKRRLVGDEVESDDHWAIGHPILFPNILRVSHGLEFRTPIDDTHTMHLITNYRQYKDGEELQTEVPFHERSAYDENGKLVRDYVVAQDAVAWIIQGDIMDRTTERLGVSDVGIIMYRRMLEEQMEAVAAGQDPLNTHRDPVENEVIVLPCEYYMYPGYEEVGGPFRGKMPKTPDVEAVLSGDGVKRDEWEGIEASRRVWGVDTGGVREGETWFSDGAKH
ncbi:MAG: aromatic ring-hydroxylating dioxygenase subunit alpha [Dehalococcoidia bacterium]